MKAGTLNHIKTKRLKHRLKVPLWQAAGLLETLWQLATECADEGDVGRYSDEEIAGYFEWEGEESELIDALVDSGWLERDDECRLRIHDWEEHAPNYIKDRLKKRKQRTYAKSDGDTPGTCEGQPGDTEGTSTEKNESCPPDVAINQMSNPPNPPLTSTSTSKTSVVAVPDSIEEDDWGKAVELCREIRDVIPVNSQDDRSLVLKTAVLARHSPLFNEDDLRRTLDIMRPKKRLDNKAKYWTGVLKNHFTDCGHNLNRWLAIVQVPDAQANPPPAAATR